MLRNRRLVGVAFAGVMTVHLGLLAYRFGSQPDLDHPLLKLLFGGAAYGLFYLMLITSFDAPKKAVGPRAWKILHRAGLIWAGAIFGLPRSLESLSDPEYWQFGLPFVIGPCRCRNFGSSGLFPDDPELLLEPGHLLRADTEEAKHAARPHEV